MISKLLILLGLKKPAQFVNSQGGIRCCESLVTGPVFGKSAGASTSGDSHWVASGGDVQGSTTGDGHGIAVGYSARINETEGLGAFCYPVRTNAVDGASFMTTVPAGVATIVPLAAELEAQGWMREPQASCAPNVSLWLRTGAINPCIPAGLSAGVCETPACKPLPADATSRNVGIGPEAKRAAAEERERAARLVDHIPREGGGTWGDCIRAGWETPCCAGGPQWGHAWDCKKCPD